MKHYNNTQEFYKSKEWSDCKANITHQRMNAEGLLICEHCGKPIVKSFNPKKRNNSGAAVFHHKIYLTNLNVNDANISINPENIAVLHWKCHNEVHGRFNGSYAGRPEKKVYIVTGAPCSGKKEWVSERIQEGDIILDIDSLWECLSGQPRYTKPAQLKPVIFPARLLIKDQIAKGAGSWRNAYIIEGQLATAKEIEDEADKFKAHNVEVITMDTTREECIDRLRINPEGRNIEEYTKYINEYYDKKR